MKEGNSIISLSEGREKKESVLNCEGFWQCHDTYLVKSSIAEKLPFFYPVYRWEDYYAFSPVPLILKKGYINIAPRVEYYLRHTKGDVMPPQMFIDSEIERIGGPPELSRAIRDPENFCYNIASAMQVDVTEIEKRNPGKTNVILCGGKDSLNLLLLKWQNPTLIYSAAPNFALVCQFVLDNNLNFEVRELHDKLNNSLLSREVLEACCMVDLSNWRWTGHLCEIAKMLDFQAIFWKGQFADAIMTDYWRSYTCSFSKSWKMLKKSYKRAARVLPETLTEFPDRLTLKDFQRSIWQRGAVMQGAHMGLLRSITDCLFVSAYHGPQTSQVWLAGDYPKLTMHDLRPDIGRILAGKDVIYPSENPAPPLSGFRRNSRNVENLAEACAALGIPIRRQS